MSDVTKLMLYIVGFVIGLFALGWAVQGNNFFLYKFFAPKYEEVRRETFEQTKSYRQGMIQELENFQVEYLKASDEHKKVIRGIILKRVAGFDLEKDDVSSDLRDFIAQLKREERGL